MIAPKDEVRLIGPALRPGCRALGRSTLNTGEFGQRSGETRLSVEDGLCRANSRPSTEPLPAGLTSSSVGLVGLEQPGDVGPVRLPTEKEEGERVGLC